MPPPRADAAFTPTVPTAGSSYQFGDVGRDAGNEALQAAYAQLADAVNPQSRNLLDVVTNYATGTAGGLLSGAIGLGQKAGGYAADVLGAGAEALGSDRWSRGGAAQALYGDMGAGAQAAGLGTEANALGLLSDLGAGKYARGAIADRLNQTGPVPTMYSNPIAGLLGDAGKKNESFDIVRKDASSIFGAGTERVRYTDPKSGGTMEVVVRPDGSASVLELEVPETSRGKGIGQSLQERVMQDFPVMGGQVSSKAAATTAYRLGRRPVGKPNATLEDVFAEMDDMSSVNMVSPQMQERIAPTALTIPAPRNEAETMARDILQLRSAGRADEVTEQMMAAADPQYMYANTPLPMDYASRMARKDAMYGKDRYHGSNMDFAGFSGNVFTSDNPTVASTYNRGMLDAQIYPVVTREGPMGAVNVEGGLSNWNQLRPEMIDDPVIAQQLNMGMPVSTRDIERQAAFEGRSSVTFKDINDLGPGFNSQKFKGLGYTPEQEEALRLQYLRELSVPSDVDVRLSPNLVRSRFARFDPEFANLRNLSASVGAGLLGANMMPERGNQQ
jgi:hypothetical protein